VALDYQLATQHGQHGIQIVNDQDGAAAGRGHGVSPGVPPAGPDDEMPGDHRSDHGADGSDEWAWVELNYRPHAYQPPKASDDQRPPA
jgi:hypothetical protein